MAHWLDLTGADAWPADVAANAGIHALTTTEPTEEEARALDEQRKAREARGIGFTSPLHQAD